VRGHFWSNCCSRFDVDARSGPSGENPRGRMSYYVQSSSEPPNPDTFAGVVSCLAVQGLRAAVGAVGKWHRNGTPDRWASILLVVEDGRTKLDSLTYTEVAGSTPPNCATASFENPWTPTDGLHEFIVNNAAP
jgi:hypothetical protein